MALPEQLFALAVIFFRFRVPLNSLQSMNNQNTIRPLRNTKYELDTSWEKELNKW